LKKNVFFHQIKIVKFDKCYNEHNEQNKKITVIELSELVPVCPVIKIFDENLFVQGRSEKISIVYDMFGKYLIDEISMEFTRT